MGKKETERKRKKRVYWTDHRQNVVDVRIYPLSGIYMLSGSESTAQSEHCGHKIDLRVAISIFQAHGCGRPADREKREKDREIRVEIEETASEKEETAVRISRLR